MTQKSTVELLHQQFPDLADYITVNSVQKVIKRGQVASVLEQEDAADTAVREAGYDPDLFEISAARSSSWTGQRKGGQLIDLSAKQLTISRRSVPRIHQVPEREIIPWTPSTLGVRFGGDDVVERWAILGDTQWPHGNETAWRLWLAWKHDVAPTHTIYNGDNLDGERISRWQTTPDVPGPQDELNYADARLAESLAAHRSSQEIMHEGNHDRRFIDYIIKQAGAFYGLKRPGEDQPIYSLPHLLRLPERGIQYIPEYPHARTIITPDGPDPLPVMHGYRVKKDAAATALQTMNDFDSSVVVGHVHRLGITKITRGTPFLGKERRVLTGVEVGMMCEPDLGYLPNGTANWQMGWSVIEVFSDRTWQASLVEVNPWRGVATWRGYQWKLSAEQLTEALPAAA